MHIADVLRNKGSDVVTVDPSATVAELIAALAERNVGALPVVEAGRLVGIVSERDVVRALGRHGATVLGMAVEEIMTRNVRTCEPTETVAQAMARMTAGRYRHLPVVQGRTLVGLVSIGDLVKHRVKEMELETGVLRDAVIARY